MPLACGKMLFYISGFVNKGTTGTALHGSVSQPPQLLGLVLSVLSSSYRIGRQCVLSSTGSGHRVVLFTLQEKQRCAVRAVFTCVCVCECARLCVWSFVEKTWDQSSPFQRLVPPSHCLMVWNSERWRGWGWTRRHHDPHILEIQHGNHSGWLSITEKNLELHNTSDRWSVSFSNSRGLVQIPTLHSCCFKK